MNSCPVCTIMRSPLPAPGSNSTIKGCTEFLLKASPKFSNFVLPIMADGLCSCEVKTIFWLTGPNSKKAVMGTSNARANCCNVLTEGEDFPFSNKLNVLIFKPLRSAKARNERQRLLRNSRSFLPTNTSVDNSSLKLWEWKIFIF